MAKKILTHLFLEPRVRIFDENNFFEKRQKAHGFCSQLAPPLGFHAIPILRILPVIQSAASFASDSGAFSRGTWNNFAHRSWPKAMMRRLSRRSAYLCRRRFQRECPVCSFLSLPLRLYAHTCKNDISIFKLSDQQPILSSKG